MTTTIRIFSAIMLSIMGLVFSEVRAQESVKTDKTTISIETDPSTFLFNGYALHIRIKPKSSEHLLIGAGTYALDMPSFLVDMNKSNKGKGWEVRINSAYSAFAEYYFKQANNKWFAGLQIGVQNYKNANSHVLNQESKYANVLVMPSIGYNWHPLKNGLYVKPWIGIGYTSKVSGDNTLGSYEYEISPLANFVTVHLGYTF